MKRRRREVDASLDLGAVSNVDDLLRKLGTTEEPAEKIDASEASEPIVETPEVPDETPQVIAPSLSIHLNASVLDIAPRRLETYARGVQTDPVEKEDAVEEVAQEESKPSVVVREVEVAAPPAPVKIDASVVNEVDAGRLAEAVKAAERSMSIGLQFEVRPWVH